MMMMMMMLVLVQPLVFGLQYAWCCPPHNMCYIYRVCINYQRISLRHNLSRKCSKIVKFVSITHSERNIWNGPIVATAILREKLKVVLEGNGCQNTPIIYTHPVL
jgi:hypothetical protein